VETYETHISKHAINRYRERIGPLPEKDYAARIIMFGEMMQSADRHLRKALIRRKRTSIIPTAKALFVTSFGNVVTVLERDRSAA
jgi:hypothetical protein